MEQDAWTELSSRLQSVLDRNEILEETLYILLSYTLACEHLLNSHESGQCKLARRVLEAEGKYVPSMPIDKDNS